MFKELEYEDMQSFIYVKCECGETISMYYEGQYDKCPFCNKNIDNKSNQ